MGKFILLCPHQEMMLKLVRMASQGPSLLILESHLVAATSVTILLLALPPSNFSFSPSMLLSGEVLQNKTRAHEPLL